jgi:copper chaperone
MEHATLTIEGMSCGHCVRAVRDALEGLPGVRVDEVEIGTATIAYDPAAVGLERVTAAVEEEGYRVAGSRETR